ncbi:MAG: hypothetical protein Q9202_007650 [Teloschistes flavicans]
MHLVVHAPDLQDAMGAFGTADEARRREVLPGDVSGEKFMPEGFRTRELGPVGLVGIEGEEVEGEEVEGEVRRLLHVGKTGGIDGGAPRRRSAIRGEETGRGTARRTSGSPGHRTIYPIAVEEIDGQTVMAGGFGERVQQERRLGRHARDAPDEPLLGRGGGRRTAIRRS